MLSLGAMTLGIVVVGILRMQKDRRWLKRYEMLLDNANGAVVSLDETVTSVDRIDDRHLSCDPPRAISGASTSTEASTVWPSLSAITLQLMHSIAQALFHMTGIPLMRHTSSHEEDQPDASMATTMEKVPMMMDQHEDALPILEARAQGSNGPEDHVNEEDEVVDDSFSESSFRDSMSDADSEAWQSEADSTIMSTTSMEMLDGVDFYRQVACVAQQNVQQIMQHALTQAHAAMEKQRIQKTIRAIEQYYPDITCLQQSQFGPVLMTASASASATAAPAPRRLSKLEQLEMAGRDASSSDYVRPNVSPSAAMPTSETSAA